MISIVATRGEQLLSDVGVEQLAALLGDPGVHVWVDLIPPIGDAERRVMTEVFGFHPLAVEDCFETRVYPKIDDYDEYLYLVTHGMRVGSTPEEAVIVEIDSFVGRNFLLTHHTLESRSILAVREQVLRTGLPLRRGPFSVLHAIADRQVDGLESVMDDIEARISSLEDDVFERPGAMQIEALLRTKRTILQIRRWVSRQREVVLRLGRREFPLVGVQESMLFRDVHDHLVRFGDLLESFREMLSSIQEAYLSVTSNRLNEIMKYLTVVTVVLMPLTVITGIYGMNFEHMPEIRQTWGYPLTLGLMALISAGILIFIRRRGWIGRPPLPPPPVRIRDLDVAPRDRERKR